MISRDEAVHLAVEANVLFLVIDKVNKASAQVVEHVTKQGLDNLDELEPGVKETLGSIAKQMVLAKGVLSVALDHLSTTLGEYSDAYPQESEFIKQELETNSVILDIRRSLEMTPGERIIEILTKAGKLDQ